MILLVVVRTLTPSKGFCSNLYLKFFFKVDDIINRKKLYMKNNLYNEPLRHHHQHINSKVLLSRDLTGEVLMVVSTLTHHNQ